LARASSAPHPEGRNSEEDGGSRCGGGRAAHRPPLGKGQRAAKDGDVKAHKQPGPVGQRIEKPGKAAGAALVGSWKGSDDDRAASCEGLWGAPRRTA